MKSWPYVAGALAVVLLAAFALRAAAHRGGETPATQKTLAVLPFQNLGRADDAYFADGMTEEITERLASLKGLRVIGRQSAIKYAKTNKSAQQIGSELGVNYLLTGTVRWDKSSGGKNTVRITPALLKVSDGTQLWGERYESVLSGVFELQSSVAKQVATALDVALGAAEQRTLAVRPTESIEAYDYFLRGNEHRLRSYGPKDNRLAAEMYRNAVGMDSKFALAWANLSIVETDWFWVFGDRSAAQLARAKNAVDSALRLDPDLPAAHVALGVYYYHGHLDYGRALKEFTVAERNEPNNVDLITYKASLERRQGKWNEALRDFERAVELDPTNATPAMNLADTYICLRDYVKARKVAARVLELVPTSFASYKVRAAAAIGMGNTDEALRALREGVAMTGSVTELWGYEWPAILDPGLKSKMIAEKLPAGSGGDIPFRESKAILYRYLGDSVLMRAYADSIVRLARASISARPDEPNFHGDLAVALALLGNKSEADSEAVYAIRLRPLSKDAYAGQDVIVNEALVAVLNGEHELALRFLQQALSIPGDFNPGSARVDPIWAPLRRDPRFKQIVGN